ncbi:MAG TPA: hypothetical protein VF912_11495 [Anaeromyxobacter sp.]
MTIRTRFLAAAALAAAVLAPARGSALQLLDDALSLESRPRPDLKVALLAPGAGPSLDFDLLGDAPKPPAVAEDPALRTRRKMLNLHQGLGLGLLGLQLASTVTGQLNYNDKFGVDNTGRYEETHKFLTYTNLAAFAVVGGIALFAPRDKAAKRTGFGRTTVHKIGMGLATAGMIGQGLLGVHTARREGYLDQERYGRDHLVLGYLTLAAMTVAVGAIVF